jgi:hypothetical protein
MCRFSLSGKIEECQLEMILCFYTRNIKHPKFWIKKENILCDHGKKIGSAVK